jgi:hypothetical protein
LKYLNFYKKPDIKKNYFINFCFFKYTKLNKNIFIKNLNKKIKNFKDKSFNRDKNIPILKKYFNISVYNGKKESFFNNFNKFVNIFYFIFIKKNNYFFNQPNYENLFKLLELKKINFDFNYLIKDFLYEYVSIFDINIVKVPKKYKLKFKKKFMFELSYIYSKKRLKYILKLLNNFVKNNKNLNLTINLF